MRITLESSFKSKVKFSFTTAMMRQTFNETFSAIIYSAYSRRGFRGGRNRRTPPCSPLYVRPNNKFAPPVQSDNFYCLRPPVQHFLDPRLYSLSTL